MYNEVKQYAFSSVYVCLYVCKCVCVCVSWANIFGPSDNSFRNARIPIRLQMHVAQVITHLTQGCNDSKIWSTLSASVAKSDS